MERSEAFCEMHFGKGWKNDQMGSCMMKIMKHSTGTPVGFHVYKPGKRGLIRGEIGMSRLNLTSRFVNNFGGRTG
ncbi:hypothetical protein Peur_041497 [Populus x canadensis]